MQLAHLGRQRRLVAYSRGHAAEEGGYLRTGLGEPKDVVDEQQNVGSDLITEVFGHGQCSQSDSQTSAGRLGHLPVNQSSLRLSNRALVHMIEIELARLFKVLVERLAEVNYFRFNHFANEVVSLAGSLPHSAEHRETTVLQGDVVYEFHDEHGFPDSGAAEQPDLASAQERFQQIDDFDAGYEHL